MKPLDFAEVRPEAWDEACDASAQSWLFHRAAWVAIEARRFVRANRSFALATGGELVAIQPLYLSDGGTGTAGERLLHCGVHRHTGLALRLGLAEPDARAARSAAMQRIFEIAEREDVDRVQLNSHNLAPENLGPDRREIPFWVEDHGFEPGLGFTSYGMLPAPGFATVNSDQIVALDASEEVLFSRLEDACRRAVRKATKHGLEVTRERGASAVEEHYRLAGLSAERTGEELPPLDYYREIWSAFAASERCVALFATRESKPVASLLLLVERGAAAFLAGASDPEHLPLRVNDFLHWSAILWAKRAALHHYRLGPWFPTVDPEWPIATVSRFKKKFGGRAFSVLQGSHFRRPERYRDAAEQHVRALCQPRPKASATPDRDA